jgi:hypothetical protein
VLWDRDQCWNLVKVAANRRECLLAAEQAII